MKGKNLSFWIAKKEKFWEIKHSHIQIKLFLLLVILKTNSNYMVGSTYQSISTYGKAATTAWTFLPSDNHDGRMNFTNFSCHLQDTTASMCTPTP